MLQFIKSARVPLRHMHKLMHRILASLKKRRREVLRLGFTYLYGQPISRCRIGLLKFLSVIAVHSAPCFHRSIVAIPVQNSFRASAQYHSHFTIVVLTSLQAGPILYLGLAHGLQVRSDAVVSQPQIQLSNCNILYAHSRLHVRLHYVTMQLFLCLDHLDHKLQSRQFFLRSCLSHQVTSASDVSRCQLRQPLPLSYFCTFLSSCRCARAIENVPVVTILLKQLYVFHHLRRSCMQESTHRKTRLARPDVHNSKDGRVRRDSSTAHMRHIPTCEQANSGSIAWRILNFTCRSASGTSAWLWARTLRPQRWM